MSMSGFAQIKTYYMGEYKSGARTYLALYLDDPTYGDHVRIYSTRTHEGQIISVRESKKKYFFRKENLSYSTKVYFQYFDYYKEGMLFFSEDSGLRMKKIDRSEVPSYINSKTVFERSHAKY